MPVDNPHPTGVSFDSEPTVEYELTSPVSAQDGIGPPTFQFVPSTPDAQRTAFVVPHAPAPSSSLSHFGMMALTPNRRSSSGSRVATPRPHYVSLNPGQESVEMVELPYNREPAGSIDSHNNIQDQDQTHLRPEPYHARDMQSKSTLSRSPPDGDASVVGTTGRSSREGHSADTSLDGSQKSLAALSIGVRLSSFRPSIKSTPTEKLTSISHRPLSWLP